MTDVFSFCQGELPLLISIPHDGRHLAPGQAENMSHVAKGLPDTDWHVAQLYQFAEAMGANILVANYSRYVVDLNRADDDATLYAGQMSTGLCPLETFAGENIYSSGRKISAEEQQQRLQEYWRPYHAQLASTLAALRERHGYALLWDAHSIASEVPLLFPGVLPDINLGTNGGESCSSPIIEAVMSVADQSSYSTVLNARFRGGFITRNYGSPNNNVHAIQLELSQRNYMHEKNMRYDAARADQLALTIESMLKAFVSAAAQR